MPRDVIAQWPEVFNDITVDAIPLEYLDSLLIYFNDGKVWDVEVSAHVRTHQLESFEAHIQELLIENDENIERIDFRIDVEKVKKDVTKKTKQFLKANRKT